MQSWLHGKAIQQFEPETVELHTSRGYETQHSKLLLRWSVILSDLTCEPLNGTDVHPTDNVPFPVFIPAALWTADIVSEDSTWVLLLQPCLLLIDHGHFQYNCISLGLTLLAVICILTHRHVLGSALFVGAFNHKHMSLYFAMAFFGHLFGHCLQQRTLLGKVHPITHTLNPQQTLRSIHILTGSKAVYFGRDSPWNDGSYLDALSRPSDIHFGSRASIDASFPWTV